MSEFEGRYTIEYRKGRLNSNADALSRLPTSSTQPEPPAGATEAALSVQKLETCQESVPASQFCADYIVAFAQTPKIDLTKVGEMLRSEQEKDPQFWKLIQFLRQGISVP